jgi:3-oxoacyl-[acyl-carrier-protein] synthase I
MTAQLAVLSSGTVAGVGLTASASCAAIRCGINNFNETHFIDRFGERIVGSEAPLEQSWRGVTKLAKMAASAVRECIDTMAKPPKPDRPIPLILVIAEEERPGRLPGLGGPLLFSVEREIGLKFHPDSSVMAQGRVGGAMGLLRAQKLIEEQGHSHVILCGVDTFLTGPTLSLYDERARLLTSRNSDGFIPGEAAAAVALASSQSAEGCTLTCRGLGFAREQATVESDRPLRAEGMALALRSALEAAGIGLEKVDYRISDLSGEQYRFKEVSLATTRIRRDHRVGFGVWHPADCIGEVGAAALPSMLVLLHHGARKRYLPGPTFVAFLSNDDDKRAAVVLSAQGGG